MPRFKVVVTDHFFGALEIERRELAAIDAEVVDAGKEAHEGKIHACMDADGIINLFYPLDPAFLTPLRRCRVISRYGTGYDNVDVRFATTKGIAVVNVTKYCMEEVSDQAMALIYALARKIIPYHLNVMEGKWDYTVGKPIYRMRGQELGLLGLGSNAQALGSKAQGVGLKVIAHDPFIPADAFQRFGAESVTFEELLHRSDYISIHAALTDQTRNLFSFDAFRKMKKSAFIINTARGGIIDNDALFLALSERWIAGAGLEVTDPEPLPPDSPLRKLDNVIFAPHTGWYSEDSLVDLRTKVALGVVKVLKGEMPASLVNKEVLAKLPLQG